MGIRIYNTLTKRKEDFIPRQPGRVDIYQCGVTPYDYTHMGHARQYVLWDIIRKYLRYRGFQTFCVQNVTDIEDKIIARAAAKGISPSELARQFDQEFLETMEALGVEPPDVYPRVTDHIDDIIAVIDGLVRNGHAYETENGVYFDVASFPGYGKLSGRTRDEMLAGARVEVDEKKKDPADFALWKKAKPGEPAWNSPWGPGRPGWHIECSTLALKYLGSGFDMHGGGTDLIFPHHENEIAQAEAYTGKEPFVRYWVHHEMLNVDREKMSKSLGNLFTVRDVLRDFRPEEVRYFLVSTHYRSPANFGVAELESARSALDRLLNALDAIDHALKSFASSSSPAGQGTPAEVIPDSDSKTGEGPEGSSILAQELIQQVEKARRDFIEAMDDDFNTAGALGALHSLARAANTFLRRKPMPTSAEEVAGLKAARETLLELGDLLGIYPRGIQTAGTDHDLFERLIEFIVEVRDSARRRKDWQVADEIRDGLGRLGIILEDTPQGTRWKKERI